jgi:hypothetical protein
MLISYICCAVFVLSSDIVTLLCLRNAKAGGLSSWSSSISVHNEILRRAPHLAEALAGPDWYYDRKGEVSLSSFRGVCVEVLSWLWWPAELCP